MERRWVTGEPREWSHQQDRREYRRGGGEHPRREREVYDSLHMSDGQQPIGSTPRQQDPAKRDGTSRSKSEERLHLERRRLNEARLDVGPVFGERILPGPPVPLLDDRR